MTPYLPTLHNLAGAAGLVATLLLFLALGALTTARRGLPEVALVAGWGLVCVVLTVWGMLTAASLRLPVAALAMIAVVGLVVPNWRQRIGSLGSAGRLLLLTVPLWLVMLPLRPSQVDTWLNLLPNAGYLFTYNMLPTAAGPPSYSFLPVAPYNTQFAGYIASVISGGFADSAMALFSIALQCAAALLLARVLAGRDEPLPWWACACGLLLTVPLNPGFVPRVFFASYGEAPLAVTTMLAVWLSAALIEELAAGARWPRSAMALAWTLAALVNIKQSGVGLLAPIGVTLLALVLLHPRVPRWRGIGVVLAAMVPGLALYLLWQVFAARSFVAGELEPLPFRDWNFPLLPQILLAMLHAIVEKATLFLCLGVVVGGGVWAFCRARWHRDGVLLMLAAGCTLLFNAFLVVTYVAHFPPSMAVQAHSYFRYDTQLSLLIILGLVVMLRPLVAQWLGRWGDRVRPARRAAVVLILVLPLVLVPALRFDLDAPQPVLWQLGHQAAERIAPDARVAIVVPGDTDDAVGSMLRGVLLFTPPARPRLDLRTETNADPATFAALAAAGYRLALVSCTPAGLQDVPAHVAALLQYGADGWRPLASWPYPVSLPRQHFAALLARAPLCAATPAG
jgi:hypothetical protein